MDAYDYIKDDLAGYPFNAKYPPNYEKNGGLYHGYKTTLKRRFTTTLLFRGTTYVSVTTARSIISSQSRIMPLNAMSTLRMNFGGSKMVMLLLRSLKLMGKS